MKVLKTIEVNGHKFDLIEDINPDDRKCSSCVFYVGHAFSLLGKAEKLEVCMNSNCARGHYVLHEEAENKESAPKVDTPTVDQVAWVFEKIVENAKADGSFRHLIYDCMGFNAEAYDRLYKAGGMYITNGLNEEEHGR